MCIFYSSQISIDLNAHTYFWNSTQHSHTDIQYKQTSHVENHSQLFINIYIDYYLYKSDSYKIIQ